MSYGNKKSFFFHFFSITHSKKSYEYLKKKTQVTFQNHGITTVSPYHFSYS